MISDGDWKLEIRFTSTAQNVPRNGFKKRVEHLRMIIHFEKSSNIPQQIYGSKQRKKSIVQLALKSYFPHSINYKTEAQILVTSSL